MLCQPEKQSTDETTTDPSEPSMGWHAIAGAFLKRLQFEKTTKGAVQPPPERLACLSRSGRGFDCGSVPVTSWWLGSQQKSAQVWDSSGRRGRLSTERCTDERAERAATGKAARNSICG